MTEQLRLNYRRLFEVRILHHYWLDEGATVFDSIEDKLVKQRRLSAYDVRSFLQIVPTRSTLKLLKGSRALHIDTAHGFSVAVPETALFGKDAVFEFALTVRRSSFFNYTALTLRRQKIVDLYDAETGRRYRCKENVPVLSNLTGVSRGAANDRTLFLSKEFPSASSSDQAESLVISGNALKQLSCDGPGFVTETLVTQAKQLPVFVHQGDIPVLNLPVRIMEKPFHGIELTEDIPENLFALLRLHAIRPRNSAFSLTDNKGRAKSNPPVFEVRFKNRSTIRHYIDKRTGSLDSEETAPLPLTFYGNAGNKRKPSETSLKVITDKTRIVKLVSEIYV